MEPQRLPAQHHRRNRGCRRMRRMIQISGLVTTTALLAGCGSSNDEPLWKNESSAAGKSTDSAHVKTISLTYDDSVFPAGEGRKQFLTSCTVCHSLRYITMQPDFPKATWAKTVDKMRK